MTGTALSSASPDQPVDFFDFDADTGTDAVVTSHELSVTRSKLGDLLDLLPAGLLIHQEQGAVYANIEAARILGLGKDDLIGRHFLDFVAPEHQAVQTEMFYRCLREHTMSRSENCVVVADNGQRVSVQVSMAPLPWEGLPVIHVLLHDITLLKESEEQLRRLSITDPLTGAFNRRHFVDVAEVEIERSRRYQRPLGLLMLDIDHFKRINDTHGHAVGDDALKLFTNICQAELRQNDLLGRLGGEEFAVLLPETDEAGALAVAERMRRRVAATPVGLEDGVLHMTVSIGLTLCERDERSIDTMMSRADDALYRAKQGGRNRVVVAQPEWQG